MWSYHDPSTELPRKGNLGKWASGIRRSRKPVYNTAHPYALGPGGAEFSEECRDEVPSKRSALRKQINDLLVSAYPCFCYLLILLNRASAHTYSPYNLSVAL